MHLDLITSFHPLFLVCSLTPSSKEALLKNISSGKKGGSAGKVTNKLVHYKRVIFSYLLCVHELTGIFLGVLFFRDNRLHKLVFNVLLDGTEVAYYVDGQVVRLRLPPGFLQFILCFLWFIICIA